MFHACSNIGLVSKQTVEMNVSLAGVDGIGWLTLELNADGVN